MDPAAPRLVLSHIARRFDGAAAVNDVSLAVGEGEVVCLLGPSGCGKTTTLRIAAGVERQSAGEVWVDGRLVSDGSQHAPPEERAIGLMFQDFALFPHLSVAANVGFGLTDRGRGARVQDLLERVGLAGFGLKYPHQLSGGEQQRVALARALAPRPRIMLMDEPFSGLDDRLRDGIRDDTLAILREEGTTVLLVTHEPDEAMRMADRIALMRAGRIVQLDAPHVLYTAPVDRAAAAFFSDVNVVGGVVRGGSVETIFGPFAAPGLGDGAKAEVVFRPQHVRLDFDRAGTGPAPTDTHGVAVRGAVLQARFVGQQSLVDLLLPDVGQICKATVPGVFLPPKDTALWLTLPRDRCFVFAKAAARPGAFAA
ncbi:MAG: ABC transporter ATP-binding protein [Pseudomonadota bacterium]